MHTLGTVFLIFGLLAATSAAQEFTIQSDVIQATTIELYTSEGCSSCPPADKWLSTFKSKKTLWKKVVPLGFHVDYWDYLGWSDKMASANYTSRQRRYAQQWGNGRVYTPGIVVNGKEWRGFFKGQRSVPLSDKKVGVLSVTGQGKQLTIVFKPTSSQKQRYLGHIAFLGLGRSSSVTRGENSGRTLKHDFSVLSDQTVELKSAKGGGYSGTASIQGGPAGKYEAISVWVSTNTDITPIQAVGFNTK